MTDAERPEDQNWPERGLASPPTESAEISTGIDWDPGRDGDRRRPTTAEQAVPWLIGLILALTGIVVILVALIFTGPEGLVAGLTTPTPVPTEQPTPTTAPTLAPTPEPTERVTPSPPPAFGPLEMVYLGRSGTGKPLYLWRRDFSTTNAAIKVGDSSTAVSAFTWSPDGMAGAAIIGGHAWGFVSGQPPLDLVDKAVALAFGDDSSTLYVLRITPSGTNDQTELQAINIHTGASKSVATVTYKHPKTYPDPALKESQFGDNGGLNRLYFTVDGYVVAWILAAPQIYRFDPVSGGITEAPREPILWSPNQQLRIEVDGISNTKTNLTVRDLDGNAKGTVTVRGLVSHIRWAPTSNEIVFTLGRYGANAVVLQDLYVWDLADGHAASALTSSGLARGAEWLSAPEVWLP